MQSATNPIETPLQNTGNLFADETQTGATQPPSRNPVTNGLTASETHGITTRTNQVATVNPMERPSTSALLPATDRNNITHKRRRESSSENSTDDEKNPDVKIGKTKFYVLRPKQCISLSSRGVHNMCVGRYHLNLKFMYDSHRNLAKFLYINN